MRVFTDPFDRLMDDMQETARPQREWADGRGLLLIMGHFLSGVGAGGWAFSSALGFFPGEVASVAIVAAPSSNAAISMTTNGSPRPDLEARSPRVLRSSRVLRSPRA